MSSGEPERRLLVIEILKLEAFDGMTLGAIGLE
jgi:hypothetical protein